MLSTISINGINSDKHCSMKENQQISHKNE